MRLTEGKVGTELGRHSLCWLEVKYTEKSKTDVGSVVLKVTVHAAAQSHPAGPCLYGYAVGSQAVVHVPRGYVVGRSGVPEK